MVPQWGILDYLSGCSHPSEQGGTMNKSDILDHLIANQDPRGIAHWEKHAEKSGGLHSYGIGLTKLPSMERRKDPVAVATMRAIKQVLDPQDMMNPGKTLPKP